jgi:hypothetical protein
MLCQLSFLDISHLFVKINHPSPFHLVKLYVIGLYICSDTKFFNRHLGTKFVIVAFTKIRSITMADRKVQGAPKGEAGKAEGKKEEKKAPRVSLAAKHPLICFSS